MKLDPIRVENPIHPGTPDVNLANGIWIELKALAKYPVKPSYLLRLPWYTPQQRVWLYRRWRAGGRTYLLLEVVAAGDWLLFDGDVAAKIVGRGTVDRHRVNARTIVKDPADLESHLR